MLAPFPNKLKIGTTVNGSKFLTPFIRKNEEGDRERERGREREKAKEEQENMDVRNMKTQ